MAEGERGGGWLPPNGDDEQARREQPRAEQPGGLRSGDPLWSGPQPPAESAPPAPPSGSEPPAGGGAPPAHTGWEPPGGAGAGAPPPAHSGWEPPGGAGAPAPQPGQWGPGPQQPGYGGGSSSNGKATGSLICGILGILFCPIILSIPAIILGYQARKEIDASQGRQQNRGLATAGIITGWVGVVYGVLGIILVAIGIIGLNGEIDEGGDGGVFSEPAIALLLGALPL